MLTQRKGENGENNPLVSSINYVFLLSLSKSDSIQKVRLSIGAEQSKKISH
jgi:hypothetical protein